MSLWSWVRALTEAKEKGMGHAPIACEWDHPSSEWARGWGPYSYTSPSILPHTYTSVPYPVSTEPASIIVDIPLSSHPLPSHTLPPMDDTILDLLLEWGRLPARRPHTRRVHRLLHPSDTSAPSAPLALSQTPHDPIGQQTVYFRRRPKINIKTSSCGTH